MGPRGGLDVMAKREIPVPAGIRTLVVQPVASNRGHSTRILRCGVCASLLVAGNLNPRISWFFSASPGYCLEIGYDCFFRNSYPLTFVVHMPVSLDNV